MSQEASLSIVKKYLNSNSNSMRAFERAKKILPGGNTRDVIFYKPYPKYIKSGQGCWLKDIEGNVILDFINNYMSLILGHAHPSFIKSIKNQIEDGAAFSSPTENEFIFAEKIQKRMPSIRSLRFTNSGSESVTLTILAARCFSGKKKIGKFEGAHHGTNEATMVSTCPSLDEIGSYEAPNAVPDGPHIPDYITQNTVVMPFNNINTTERIIRKNRNELATVIVEPILGSNGIIPADKQFLYSLREITSRYSIPLIFDEVVTGFRLSKGGAQEYYNIEPDLTTLGKILGGGMPIGAFGGREDIMDQFNPIKNPKISHSGSFNANPISLKAGIAVLNELTPPVYQKLNHLGLLASEGLSNILNSNGLHATVTRASSLFCVHFTSEEVFDYRSAMSEDSRKKANYFLSLTLNNIIISPRGIGCISTPMEEKEIKSLIEISERIIPNIKER